MLRAVLSVDMDVPSMCVNVKVCVYLFVDRRCVRARNDGDDDDDEETMIATMSGDQFVYLIFLRAFYFFVRLAT